MEHSEPGNEGYKSDVYAPVVKQDKTAGKEEIQSHAVSPISFSGDVTPTENGSLQDFDSYKSQIMPRESWNSAGACDARNRSSIVAGKDKFNPCSAVIGRSQNCSNPMIRNNTFDSRPSNIRRNIYPHQYTTSPIISKSHIHTSPLKSSNQLRSGYRSTNQFQPLRKLASYNSSNQGGYRARTEEYNYRPNARMWNGSDGPNLNEKSSLHGELEAMVELTRGPRGRGNKSVQSSPVVHKRMGVSIDRDEYNLENFQTEYDNAKFYVIKSYSEDDIHKCIKYNVWSSTPYGNNKLDAAFHYSQGIKSEAGSVCPIFLFYSVNASGQFVGLAEMIGKVDYAKNMDFWQRDKWNGFFPAKWHIIKDIPNTKLRHIIIESNENKPVTESRDAQEIGLQQGLEMLKIFKSYSAVTSVLDDFDFYENREQSLKTTRNNLPAAEPKMYMQHDYPKHQRAGIRTTRGSTNNNSSDLSAITRQTKKITLM